jgi:hypothetical protein
VAPLVKIIKGLRGPGQWRPQLADQAFSASFSSIKLTISPTARNSSTSAA